MPASLATLLTAILVVALFRWDLRNNRESSFALWLPVLWIFIVGSRFPSQWLQLGSPAAVANVADGSPLDAMFFGVMIVAGLMVLIRRDVFSGQLFRRNFWLLALIIFSLVSVAWSDFPFIALKRWIKTLGHPVMAMIVLTDPQPIRALRTVMKRAAFVLLPLSVLFVKYLPEYGRGFDAWTGAGFYRGVMLTKNDLGYVCMVFGLFFLWTLFSRAQINDTMHRRYETLLSAFFLGVIAYLLSLADSATSIATLAIGVVTLAGLGSRFVSRRYFGLYLIAFVAILLTVELSFDVYDEIVSMLGRDPTLTDRKEVWKDAIALQTRPIAGMGFESFWLGPRLDWMSAKWWWQPNQAHNGYIEIFLNLGFIGLFLFIALMVSTIRKAAAGLTSKPDFEFSRLRLAILFAILSHNYTEATFKGVHLLWTMFYLIAIDIPRRDAVARSGAKDGVPVSQFRKVR
ncbi:MAG: O-antigen ligase family protein [Woeseiaceae bacterium]